MQYSICSTVQYSTVQYSKVQYSTCGASGSEAASRRGLQLQIFSHNLKYVIILHLYLLHKDENEFHLGSNNVLPSPECCIKVVKTRSGGEVELGEYTVGRMVAVKRKRDTHYFAEKKRHREDLVYEYAHRDDYEYYDEDYTIITDALSR